jgi:uncharacterized protein (DUF1697 family)
MKYVALLRGINVGGNRLIKMAALKSCLEQQGFGRVVTYIQSGNVVFESRDRNRAKLTTRIEEALVAAFGFEVPIVLLSDKALKAAVDGAPRDWKRRTDLRRNMAFLRPTLAARQAVKEVDVRDGVDVVTTGPGVIYMSTLMSAVTRSYLNKIATKKIYKEMTIRTYGTCTKLLALMNT